MENGSSASDDGQTDLQIFIISYCGSSLETNSHNILSDSF